MKKLLNLLTIISLVGSISITTVACSNKDANKITYGIVDNGVDLLTKDDWKEVEDEFYELYGTKYKLKSQSEVDDRKLPVKVMEGGGAVAGPDLYTAGIDIVPKLATNNYILALDGKDAPPFMKKILEDLNYNVEYAESILAKETRTIEEDWGTFLPYAIESSKIVNNNKETQNEGKPAQYGITRGISVSGGSGVVKKTENKVLTKLGFKYKAGTENIDPVGNTSWKKIIDYSTKEDMELHKAANEVIPMLIDRGMWEMFPIYSNIISENIKGKVYKTSEIGLNWLNNKDLSYYDDREGEYSSIFSNKYFRKSAEEIMGAFFDYFAQTYKVAFKNLHGDKDSEKAENLLNPISGLNHQVKKNLLNRNHAVSSLTETAYFVDLIEGTESFKNMEFVDMGSVKIFDDQNPELEEKYTKNGLNQWMTFPGANMMVFSKKLASNEKKALATMRFAQLALGFREKEGKVISDGTGGIFNLNKGFLNSSLIPSKIAITDQTYINDPDFTKGIGELKVPRRVESAIKKAKNYKDIWEKDKLAETKALIELEKYSINLASRLFNKEDPTISYAPNLTAYDMAGEADRHGLEAMQPSLKEALIHSGEEFEKIYGKDNDKINFDSELFKKVKEKFISSFLEVMTKINKEQSN